MLARLPFLLPHAMIGKILDLSQKTGMILIREVKNEGTGFSKVGVVTPNQSILASLDRVQLQVGKEKVDLLLIQTNAGNASPGVFHCSAHRHWATYSKITQVSRVTLLLLVRLVSPMKYPSISLVSH